MRPGDAILVIDRVPLGRVERRIANTLARRLGCWVPTEILINAAYALQADGGPDDAAAVIKSHVHHIRRKLRPYGLLIAGRNGGVGRKMTALPGYFSSPSQGETAPRAEGSVHGARGRR